MADFLSNINNKIVNNKARIQINKIREAYVNG